MENPNKTENTVFSVFYYYKGQVESSCHVIAPTLEKAREIAEDFFHCRPWCTDRFLKIFEIEKDYCGVL